jgi:hypothetical protein
MLLATGTVVLFFCAFLLVVSLGLPKGESLRDLVQGGSYGAPPGGPPQDSLMIETGRPAIVAMLSEIHRTVKHKPADYLIWSNTRPGMPLANRHAVQTLSRSKATIAFQGQSRLQMGENSLVVVKTLKAAEASSGAAAVALEGELSGRIAHTEGAPEVEVQTAGDARLRPAGPAGVPSSFELVVRNDGSSTFSIYEGAAEIVSRGESVIVEASQTVTVDPSSPPGRPERLPDPPVLIAPENGAVYRYFAQPPQIEFAWRVENGADGYRIEIARDPEFDEIVHDGTLAGDTFRHGNLTDGVYYWRVRALRGDAKSAPTRVGTFRVAQDRKTPELAVAFPEETVRADHAVLTGTAEPGSRVFVAGESVHSTEAGAFEHTVRLRRGLNLIVVEAVDSAGNTAYRSRLVRAEY